MGKRIDWIGPAGQNTSYDPTTTRSNGTRTALNVSANSRPPPEDARRPTPSSGKATTPPTTRKITYRQLYERVQVRQRAEANGSEG
jgi:hypothetical protein